MSRGVRDDGDDLAFRPFDERSHGAMPPFPVYSECKGSGMTTHVTLAEPGSRSLTRRLRLSVGFVSGTVLGSFGERFWVRFGNLAGFVSGTWLGSFRE